MKPSDYNETKRYVINKLQQVDARLKEAVTRKQIYFFKGAERQTAAEPVTQLEIKTGSPN